MFTEPSVLTKRDCIKQSPACRFRQAGDCFFRQISPLLLFYRPGSFHPTSQEILQILPADSPFTPYLHRWNQLLRNHFPYLLLGGFQQCSSLGNGEKFSYAHGSSSFLAAIFFSSLYKKLCSLRRSWQVNPQSPVSLRLGLTPYFSQLFLRFSLSISSRRQTSLML